MYVNNQLVSVIMDCVFVVGSIALMFVPFSKVRVRDSWAKAIFFAIGFIGAICYTVNLTLNMRWLVISSHNSYEWFRWLTFINGLLLGLLAALIFSGQVNGRKHPENEHLKSNL